MRLEDETLLTWQWHSPPRYDLHVQLLHSDVAPHAVCWLEIPALTKNSPKSLDMYSPPLSSRKILILWLTRFSTYALYLLNAKNASDLLWRRTITKKHVASSMKVTQYQ